MATPDTTLTVLGIETSCDETAAAVVDGRKRILSNRILSQIDDHAPYGGIVPEIAARAHVAHLDRLVESALEEAGLELGDVDAIAATAGPGLIGGVMVGVVTAKTLALAAGKPFIAVNHLEGHALSARLVADVDFPFLLLLISGGHCQLLAVEGVGRYTRLGTTIDDAVGEAFDKGAKLLGLGYPGGPAIERLAGTGNAERFQLPRPLTGTDMADFSFSGLKTALARAAEAVRRPDGGFAEADRADLAAGLQAAIVDCLADRTRNAMRRFRNTHPGLDEPALVVAGGVAANRAIADRLTRVAAAEGFALEVPPAWLCTDNAAMIAWAGIERFRLGLTDNFATPARARWPLDATSPPAYGGGRKGAKA